MKTSVSRDGIFLSSSIFEYSCYYFSFGGLNDQDQQEFSTVILCREVLLMKAIASRLTDIQKTK